MHDCWDFDRLSREEWAAALKPDILPEFHEAFPSNYVLMWGHNQ
jgi:hypothetical protein